MSIGAYSNTITQKDKFDTVPEGYEYERLIRIGLGVVQQWSWVDLDLQKVQGNADYSI